MREGGRNARFSVVVSGRHETELNGRKRVRNETKWPNQPETKLAVSARRKQTRPKPKLRRNGQQKRDPETSETSHTADVTAGGTPQA